MPPLNHESASSPVSMEGMDLRSPSMKGERSEGLRKKHCMVESLEEAWSAWVEEGSGVLPSSGDEVSREAMVEKGASRRGREAR